MGIKFTIQLTIPHIVNIYRQSALIGQINTEFTDITLFESINYDEANEIFLKIMELVKNK